MIEPKHGVGGAPNLNKLFNFNFMCDVNISYHLSHKVSSIKKHYIIWRNYIRYYL
jgi:hypothetical protein